MALRWLPFVVGGLVACSQPQPISNNVISQTDTAESGGTRSSRGGASGTGGRVTGGVGGTVATGGNASSGAPSGGVAMGGGAGGSLTQAGGATAGGSTNLGGNLARGGGGGALPATGGASTGGTVFAAGGSLGGSLGTGGTPQGGAPCTDFVGRPARPYPFPQNLRSPYCIYPKTACSSDARAAYVQWKSDLVVSDGAGGFQRVRRPDNENGTTDTTVSEGIAYGMMLAVAMDDQPLFDNLWQYSQLHLDGLGLMIWLIEAGGEPGVEDAASGKRASGSATDADEDMAWALALAAQKWGGSGTLSDTYANLATSMMGRIWASEADSRYTLLNAGDSWDTTFAWNPSYFAPNEYRLFAKLDTEHAAGWTSLIDKGYEILAASQNQTSGLVPAWTDAAGVPTPAWPGAPTHYQYDAARVAFRIGLDYCDFGDPRAQAILSKLTTFFSGVGAAGIVDGYELDGTPRAQTTSPAGVQSAVFLGPAGVGAMSTTNQAFVDSVYLRLVAQPRELMLPPSYYFALSWKVFSLAMMSGNLFDYTLYP